MTAGCNHFTKKTITTLESISGTFEIIMTDDYSTENSWQVTKEIQQKNAWVQLIQKIYEVDLMIFQKYFHEMKVIAIITSEYEVKKILRHLLKNEINQAHLIPSSELNKSILKIYSYFNNLR